MLEQTRSSAEAKSVKIEFPTFNSSDHKKIINKAPGGSPAPVCSSETSLVISCLVGGTLVFRAAVWLEVWRCGGRFPPSCLGVVFSSAGSIHLVLSFSCTHVTPLLLSLYMWEEE